MRIVSFQELPVGWEPDHVLLMHQAFGRSWDPRRLGREHQYPPFADYVGLCALDEGKLVASVTVHRFPFRSRSGEFTCSGLGVLATLSTHRGRGLARRLIEEAHAREREAGNPLCLLYTGRSNVAHSLYEHLGYRDILEFGRAVRPIPRTKSRLPTGWVLRRARKEDRQVIERIHAARVRNFYGFTRRDSDWWPGSSGWLVVENAGRPRGYAQIETQGRIKGCHEAIGLDSMARRVLLSALESRAAGTWLLLGSGPIRELEGDGGLREYSFYPSSYGVLMAAQLQSPAHPEDLGHTLGLDSDRFAFGYSDGF